MVAAGGVINEERVIARGKVLQGGVRAKRLCIQAEAEPGPGTRDAQGAVVLARAAFGGGGEVELRRRGGGDGKCAGCGAAGGVSDGKGVITGCQPFGAEAAVSAAPADAIRR